LTAGVVNKLELDSINGNVAGILAVVKPTGVSNSSDGLSNYVSLGDSATFDLLDAGSRSVWGSGQAIDSQYIRKEVWASHYGNDYSQKKNFYWIPFTSDSRGSFAGKVDGYQKMDGDRNFLAIKPATTGTKPVCFLRIPEQATAGSFKIRFKNSLTASIPYNATLASIQSNVNSMFDIFNATPNPLSVVVSGTQFSDNSGTDMIFSFDQYVDLEDNLFILEPEGLEGASGAISVQTGLTQRGISGFDSGQFDISLYAYVHSKLHKDTKGRLAIETEN